MDRRGFFRRIAGCLAGAVASPLAISAVPEPKYRDIAFKVTDLPGYTRIHDKIYYSDIVSMYKCVEKKFKRDSCWIVNPDALEILES